MARFPILLLSLAIFSNEALAARSGRKAAARKAAEAQPSPEGSSIWDQIEAEGARTEAWPTPAEGSLMQFIEPGAEAEASEEEAEAIEEASEELAEARENEASFLAKLRISPPVEFYQDPVGALAHDPLYLDKVNVAEFDIPVDVNEDVVRWMRYFTGKGRKYYARWLARSTTFRPMMYEKLKAAGMPADLVYLSMIESGYSPNAYSTAAAAGLWQFIPSTGRQYKLRVDSWVDERRDPERATDAALAFMKDLYADYGDWRLVWAAYNGGPGRVERGMARHGTKDFWKLVEKDAFASETDNYVPKLMAAAIIGKHPERYGFTQISYEAPLKRDTVSVEGPVSVDVLAKCAGVSETELRNLNPHLRQAALPPGGTVFLHVPTGASDRFEKALAKVPASERVTWREHRVAKGETLSTIAKRYGVSMASLQQVNHIKNANLISVGQRLIIPSGGGASYAAVAEAPAPAPAKTSSASTASSSASSSKALVSTAGTGSSAPRSKTLWHTVSKGEALSAIAARYGVSTSDLMRWNGISNANKILVGQKLKIYSSASQWGSHTVGKGETLSSIAAKNGCTVQDLMSWNNLKSSTIFAGQQLKIRKG